MSKVIKRKLFADDDVRDVFTPCGSPEKARVDPTYAVDSQINNMLAKFARGEVHQREPIYADVSQFGDFREMQERVMMIRREFDKLPSAVRNLCGNDPTQLSRVANDPKNKDFLVEHGFFEQVVPEGPLKVEVVNKPDVSKETSGAGSGAQSQGEPKGAQSK